jgi:hypothetical protein
MSDDKTYAEIWADEINRVYDSDDVVPDDFFGPGDLLDGESTDDAVHRILMKAARVLRGYDETATFTGRELDLVRYLMPAHEVHQSGTMRFVADRYPASE